MNIIEELKKPFAVESIHWRVGATNQKKLKPGDQLKGIPLAYINARDVMERLDFVIGCENWQDRYPRDGCCELGLRINGEWVWKSDGAGQTDVEGEKGQYSDALKRAAVKWGVGRYLYDLPNEWVELTGNTYKPFKTPPKLPQWATPGGWNRVSTEIKREVYSQTIDCLAKDDAHGLAEIWGEFSSEEIVPLWGMFDSMQRAAIKKLKGTGE